MGLQGLKMEFSLSKRVVFFHGANSFIKIIQIRFTTKNFDYFRSAFGFRFRN